jgi:cytochrome c oxidase cbb3-type subunit 1
VNLFYFVPLTASGLIAGYLWVSGAPFSESIIMSVPFWMFRLVSGIMIVMGFALISYNFYKTYTSGKPYREELDPLEA